MNILILIHRFVFVNTKLSITWRSNEFLIFRISEGSAFCKNFTFSALEIPLQPTELMKANVVTEDSDEFNSKYRLSENF